MTNLVFERLSASALGALHAECPRCGLIGSRLESGYLTETFGCQSALCGTVWGCYKDSIEMAESLGRAKA